MKKKLTIGSRGSALARWQAEWVHAQLAAAYPELEVSITFIKTKGDKILDVPLAKVGGKGLFVKEIEDALLNGDIDLAVHSMKDVPTVLPDGLGIAVTPEREDPRDAFFSHQGLAIGDLPAGAVIGTSSLRRRSQLIHYFPGLELKDLRGNVDTRLKKLANHEYDGIVLAYAGVKRLGLDGQVTQVLPVELSLPAIAQGALGLETRIDDQQTNELIHFLHHQPTSLAVTAERAFLRTLEGGCQVPIAAHATVAADLVTLTGLVARVDGSTVIKESRSSADDPEALGITLGKSLLAQGAGEILQECYEQENN
ncbi:MAG: hydroxymethylbilane synthase [Deltaproteobacteria bacterium]|nr:hydroxymethylbilane synthase [Candidatus Anaeroferrophillus wilburensis]MBN2888028.1 hydroxymethylbilane synthase [Deltaproteobacteria bacterium]